MNCGCTGDLEDFLYLKCFKEKESAIQKCYDLFMKKFDKDNTCYEYCPLECNSFSYDISGSSTAYLNRSFSSFQVLV